MDGLSPTRNFLDTERNRTINRAFDVGENGGGHHEIYLLISILCYNSFGAVGVQILPWTLVSELYPIQVSLGYLFHHFVIDGTPSSFVRQVKGKMGGVTVTIAYAFMFVAVKSFPYLLSHYGMEVMFYLFSLGSLLFCAFVFCFLPETYGKSLIDIQNYFVKL